MEEAERLVPTKRNVLKDIASLGLYSQLVIVSLKLYSKITAFPVSVEMKWLMTT